jgi:hypothetical protein
VPLKWYRSRTSSSPNLVLAASAHSHGSRHLDAHCRIESHSTPSLTQPPAIMLGFLTSRWQTAADPKKTSPSWYDRHVSPILLAVAKKACTHPIHTIVTIAFLASYSYLGVLDKGLMLRDAEVTAGRVDFQTLLAGSKRLRVGEETSWHWVAEEGRAGAHKEKARPVPYKARRR